MLLKVSVLHVQHVRYCIAVFWTWWSYISSSEPSACSLGPTGSMILLDLVASLHYNFYYMVWLACIEAPLHVIAGLKMFLASALIKHSVPCHDQCFGASDGWKRRCCLRSLYLCGAGLFIAFVGLRDMPVLVPAPFPNMTKLASGLNIGSGKQCFLCAFSNA